MWAGRAAAAGERGRGGAAFASSAATSSNAAITFNPANVSLVSPAAVASTHVA